RSVSTGKVLFIDASKEFVPGKNQNILGEAHIEHILNVFNQFHDNEMEAGVVEDKYAYVASLAEIKENDYNLNIPRYVDTYEEEPEIDLEETQERINVLEGELAEIKTKMNNYLQFFNN